MVPTLLKSTFLDTDKDDLILVNEDNEQVTSFVFNEHHPLSIVEQRDRLSIRKYRDIILYCVEYFQTLILVGETGCGKSTQIPQYLFETGWHHKGLIGITEPRRTAAIKLSERVALERGEEIGNSVGFVIGFNEQKSHSTKIKYMTEGILLRELLVDPLLTQYSVIMVDEVHERNLLTDTILALLKKIIKKRKSLKLIISSATTDADFFKEFFEYSTKSGREASVVLSVEGRMYSSNVFYLNSPCTNYIKETVNTVLKIHKKEPTGDILAFLTGQDEVIEAVNLMNEYINNDNLEKLQVFPMYGTLSIGDQLKTFLRPPKGIRKVIFATNIAEASITIPGIVYVIDCGFMKLKWYNLESTTNSLVIVPISKATAIQRAGRSGRMCKGKVYRLYSEAEFTTLPDHNIPEMCRADVSSVVLILMSLGISNILRFDFLSAPPIKNLHTVLELLYALGAIDENNNLLEPEGFALAEMPFDPVLNKLLYISGKMGCSEEILTIIVMLQVSNVFSKPISSHGQIKACIAKRRFEVAEGDLITLLNVYTAFTENSCTKEFCGQNYLIYRELKNAYRLREHVAEKVFRRFNIPSLSSQGCIETICKCITASFFFNAAYLHHSGIYRKIHNETELAISPQSSLYKLPQPQFVIYLELLHTTKLFMHNLTVVKGEWLSDLASHYYF